MSLAQKMKLQDLKTKYEKLSVPRRELLAKQIDNAASLIQKECLDYFTSKGFTITGKVPQVKAMYNGGLETIIDFSDLKGDFFGANGAVAFQYEKKEFVLHYSVARGSYPSRGMWAGTEEQVMQKEIEYYEDKLIPYLESTGLSDLSGEVTLFTNVKNTRTKANTQKYESVEQALNDFIN